MDSDLLVGLWAIIYIRASFKFSGCKYLNPLEKLLRSSLAPRLIFSWIYDGDYSFSPSYCYDLDPYRVPVSDGDLLYEPQLLISAGLYRRYFSIPPLILRYVISRAWETYFLDSLWLFALSYLFQAYHLHDLPSSHNPSYVQCFQNPTTSPHALIAWREEGPGKAGWKEGSSTATNQPPYNQILAHLPELREERDSRADLLRHFEHLYSLSQPTWLLSVAQENHQLLNRVWKQPYGFTFTTAWTYEIKWGGCPYLESLARMGWEAVNLTSCCLLFGWL